MEYFDELLNYDKPDKVLSSNLETWNKKKMSRANIGRDKVSGKMA